MKFGKLLDTSQVDFRLPEDPPGTSFLFEKFPANKDKPKIYVGCTGWSMKEWLGKVYPKHCKTADFLQHYSRQFSTVELNSTHYGTPSLETISKWKETAPDGFLYCPKILQRISHSGDLSLSGELLHHFCQSIAGLGDALGCSFMQLPPYFGPNKIRLLKSFLDVFPKEIPLAVEVRHEDWFSDAAAFAALFDLLEEQGVSSVITDVAGRRDVLHNRLTTDTAVLRWVGNGLLPSDYKRIDEWIEKLKSWFSQGLKQAFVFLHEPDNILAPEIVLYFVERVNTELDLDLIVPDLNGGVLNNGGQMTMF